MRVNFDRIFFSIGIVCSLSTTVGCAKGCGKSNSNSPPAAAAPATIAPSRQAPGSTPQATIGTITGNRVSPVSGPDIGGTLLAFYGQGFQNGLSVMIGGAPCRDVRYISATKFYCTTDPHVPGAVDVVITNPDSGTSTMTAAYKYAAHAAATPSLGNAAYILTEAKTITTHFNLRIGVHGVILDTVSEPINPASLLPHGTGPYNLNITALPSPNVPIVVVLPALQPMLGVSPVIPPSGLAFTQEEVADLRAGGSRITQMQRLAIQVAALDPLLARVENPGPNPEYIPRSFTSAETSYIEQLISKVYDHINRLELTPVVGGHTPHGAGDYYVNPNHLEGLAVGGADPYYQTRGLTVADLLSPANQQDAFHLRLHENQYDRGQYVALTRAIQPARNEGDFLVALVHLATSFTEDLIPARDSFILNHATLFAKYQFSSRADYCKYAHLILREGIIAQ